MGFSDKSSNEHTIAMGEPKCGTRMCWGISAAVMGVLAIVGLAINLTVWTEDVCCSNSMCHDKSQCSYYGRSDRCCDEAVAMWWWGLVMFLVFLTLGVTFCCGAMACCCFQDDGLNMQSLPTTTASAKVAVAVSTQQTVQVTVPPGAVAGQTIQIQTPSGQLMNVEIPHGLSEGQTFNAIV